MKPESRFNEFFEELGGIDNLRLMVNLKDVKYDKRIYPYDTVEFTVGWERQVTFTVIRDQSLFGPPIEGKYNYSLHFAGFCLRMGRSDIKTCLSDLIKHHTGNEIFLFP